MNTSKESQPHSKPISDDEAGQAVGGGRVVSGHETYHQRIDEQRQHDAAYRRRHQR